MDRPHKPGDIEPAPEIGQPGAARHQDELAVPHRFEFVAAHHRGSRRARPLHQRLVLANFAEDQKTATLQARDDRQRGVSEPIPSAARGARLQPQFLGATQHLGGPHRGRGKTMPDLLGIRPDPVKPQHHHQRHQPLIGRGRVLYLSCHKLSVFLARCACKWLAEDPAKLIRNALHPVPRAMRVRPSTYLKERSFRQAAIRNYAKMPLRQLPTLGRGACRTCNRGESFVLEARDFSC